jgi:hypothetical protein
MGLWKKGITMRKSVLLLLCALAALSVVACQGQTPAASIDPAMMSDMETRLGTLEGRVEEMIASMENAPEETPAEEETPDPVFDMVIATYHMDTAGFHGMDDTLNGGGEIDPGWLSSVNRINRILGVTSWPEDLQAGVSNLRETLSEFATALENDDAEAAAPLATQVHEEQHDLSHEIDEWLAESGLVEGEE